jgi:hypothetical protein
VNDNGRSVEAYGEEWAQNDGSLIKRIYRKGINPYVKGRHTISDLAQLDFGLMMEMLSSIRRRAKVSGLSDVPIVLENHTKDLRNFSDLEKFLKALVDSPDVRFITLTDLATQLNQKFKIKTRS